MEQNVFFLMTTNKSFFHWPVSGGICICTHTIVFELYTEHNHDLQSENEGRLYIEQVVR